MDFCASLSMIGGTDLKQTQSWKREFVKFEKILAWDVKDVRERSKVNNDSDTRGAPVHFAELMALCFLKNVELEKHLQKYKGRLVLRGTTSVIRMGSRRFLPNKGPELPTWWLQSHWMP